VYASARAPVKLDHIESRASSSKLVRRNVSTMAGTALDQERFVEKHWHRALRGAGVRPRKFYGLVPEQAKTQRTSGIGCSVNLRDTPFMPPIGP